ncbi:MAG: F0F1 ATP synthase subunit alpha [Bacilli bacterium]|nr:F0F1 ATP synthase subunit alpha [Bacilli bacterium]
MGDVVEIKENENQEQEAIPVNVENQEPVEVPVNVENQEQQEVPASAENGEQEEAPANEEEVAIPVDIDEEVITQQLQQNETLPDVFERKLKNNDDAITEEEYINEQIKTQNEKIQSSNNIYEVGSVTVVKDFILEVTGLENVQFYERVNIGDKGFGYVSKIEKNYITVSLLHKSQNIVVGDSVYRTNTEYKGEYSKDALGRIIDIFGTDKLNNKKFQNIVEIPIEIETFPIMDRTSVKRPMFTGIAGIDLIYPIGKGQRQLIIGDKKTGKTQICLDAIVNQKGKNMICIYVAIGKTKKEVKELYYELLKREAMNYTIIITAFNDDLPPAISFTPYYALSVAANYLYEGYDVLVVLDDLKKHADSYREICLISGKAPGRDAYPSDIFYLHSRLLERGCQYKNGGSITILPVVETKGGDITDYISTNIISITDGQIVLSSKNYQKGIKPAIDYGLSVSRLGGSVQNEATKKLGSKVRQKLLSYLETKEVYELSNVDEMSPELRDKMINGAKLLNNLIQYKYSPLKEEEILERFKEFSG